ncbi:biotin/lipoyl-containing protein [Bacillus sp. FJAT-47783]|uniref:biotin/lipoyl-containing protein n=1 Tax=Bacillus sp. FJAT-47783 TaxID=2922712 RepID=UPI001FAE4FF7|nr:biotin/lipoyl-containing protein [Bacillus sp. FJAT-47783]
MSEYKSVFSPIPGIIYLKSSPKEEICVKEGEKVKAGDIIALVEIMKNFYEVKAEKDGTIESFKVENEDIVEVGQEIAVIRVES